MKALALMFAVTQLLLISCQTSSTLPPDRELVELARHKALGQLISPDSALIGAIKTNQPVVRWSKVNWVWHYDFAWPVRSNETVRLFGVWNDKDKLDRSRIEIKKTPTDSVNYPLN